MINKGVMYMKLKVVMISSILFLLIIFAVWLGYNKYLDNNYSANATVIGIVYGSVLQIHVEGNEHFDEGVYFINLNVLNIIKDSNGKKFERFDLKPGDKIRITASPKKMYFTYEDDGTIILDGVFKLVLFTE